jgi:hypothetical protein
MKKENNLFLPRIVFFFDHFIQYRGRNKSPYGSSSWFQPSHIASEPACETAILKRYCKTSEVQRLQVHSVGGMFGYWEFLEMGIPQVTRVSILNRSNDLDALEYLHDLGTPPMENDMFEKDSNVWICLYHWFESNVAGKATAALQCNYKLSSSSPPEVWESIY